MGANSGFDRDRPNMMDMDLLQRAREVAQETEQQGAESAVRDGFTWMDPPTAIEMGEISVEIMGKNIKPMPRLSDIFKKLGRIGRGYVR